MSPHSDGITSVERDATTREAAKAEDDLQAFRAAHAWDPNMVTEILRAISNAVKNHDAEAEIALEHEFEENSPYAEVQAAVLPTDDMEIPAGTFRSWFLGMIFVTTGCGLNVLFSLRQPSVVLSSLVVQLCSYPLGVFMEKTLPRKQFNVCGWKFTLNPGPFNKKEHTLITIMANVSFAGGTAYSTATIEAQRAFYEVDYGFGFAILFTLATQVTGLGLAGIVRQFLVSPSSMIFPGILPNCALFNTLHDKVESEDPAEANGWKVPKFTFFNYVMIGAFCWYFLPGFLWTSLSVVSWVTWIKPNDAVVNQIFGGITGFSIGAPFTVFSLDWTIISGFFSSPLVVPWHAVGNTLIGLFIFTWTAGLAIHYSGAWYSAYLPVSTSKSYDNTGKTYKIKKILTKDFRLDVAKYKDYSPLFLSTTFAFSYGLSFAAIMSVLVHVGLYHGKEIWMRLRSTRGEPKDIHCRLYDKYPAVPRWWFLIIFIAMFSIGITSITAYDVQTPVWALLFGVSLAVIFLVPIGMILAITNIEIGLNVITELIISYWLPGRPMAVMIFKTMAYITISQALAYSADLKMAMYMKVPPRTLFWGQLCASVWSCFVQIGVLLWALAKIPDICAENQKNHFTCPNGRVFYNASVIWGVIGPSRMFGHGSIYGNLLWFWLIGAFTPVIFWLAARKFPKSPAKFLSAPLMFGGLWAIPPAVPMNYLMWGIVGFIFNKWIRTRARGWWLKYNYLLSASLDAGLAFSAILIFLALTMNSVQPPKWWGNTVTYTTLDAKQRAVQVVLPEGEYFGPRKGSW